MVIDNETNASSISRVQSIQDTTVMNVVKVQNQADDATKIVADNIASINTVANKIDDVLYVANDFENKVNEILAKKYDKNTKSAIDVIVQANSRFSTQFLNDVNVVAQQADAIANVSNIQVAIQNLDRMKTTFSNLNDNLSTFVDVRGSIDNVNIVATMKDTLEKVVAIQDVLLALKDRLAELQTIYFYLPDLLQVYSWIVQYKKSQVKNGFTDDEFFTSVIKLIANLESLINLSVNVKDLLAVKKQLDNAPTLLQNIKDELANLEVQYAANLRDDFTNYKRELGVFVADTKIQIGELLGLLKGTISGSNTGGGTGGGTTVAAVLGNIKQGNGIAISRDLKNDTITISSNINEFDIDTIKAGDNIKIIKRADGGITINNTLQEFDIKSAVKAGNNITIVDNPDGGIIINGQAGGTGGGDTEIGNFDIVAGWDTNINPSGSENPMVEISGFGNVANW